MLLCDYTFDVLKKDRGNPSIIFAIDRCKINHSVGETDPRFTNLRFSKHEIDACAH